MIEITDEIRNLVVNWRSKSPSPYFALEHTIQAIIKLHEANKPKPEPVAWLVRRNGYENVTVSLSKDKAISYRHEVQMRSDLSGDLNEYRIEPLYTTPPVREPLSEEEIEKLVPWQGDSKDPFFNRIEFARAIEQAHEIGTPQTTI